MNIDVEWTVGETTTYRATVDVAEVFGEDDARRVQAELDAGGDARAMLRDLVDDGMVLEDHLAGLECEGAATVKRFNCDSRDIDRWGLVAGPTGEEISVPASPAQSKAAEPASVAKPTSAERALADTITVTLPEWATTEHPALYVESTYGFCSWCSTAYSNHPEAKALAVTTGEAGQEPFGVHPHCLEPMRGEALRGLARARLRDVMAEIEPFTKAYDEACEALDKASSDGGNTEPHYGFYQRRDDAGKELADRTGALVALVKIIL